MPVAKQYASGAERQRAYGLRQAQALREHQQPQGLPALPVIATMSGEARWRGLEALASQSLATLYAEMQDYYDARS